MIIINVNNQVENLIENQVEYIKNYEMYRKDFAKILNQIKLDVTLNKATTKKFTTKFTTDQIKTYLENPQKYEKELRSVVKSLCALSPQFNRLVSYIPDMAMFNYILIPKIESKTNVAKVLKDYNKWGAYVQNMNIQHEFVKIIKSNFKYDVYYGYVLEETDSFYIKTLDPDYCKIVSIDDGCFNFAFDFAFFDQSSNKEFLDFYPKEFKSKYNKYKSSGNDFKWQELDSTYTICTKFYEDMIDITYPPYSNTFSDLYDINDYKQIDKQTAENENYQLIGFELETKDNSAEANNFKVDPYMAMEYFNLIQKSLPDGVGAFLSPVSFKTIDFNKNGQSKADRVSNSTRNFWDSAGVADVLFSSGATTAGTLKYSMLVDTTMLYGLYRQLERWLNRKLKREFKGKVSLKLLDINRLNQVDFVDQHLKLAQYGVPSKLLLASAIGLSPMDSYSLSELENSILDLSTAWKPLSSSHTNSGDEGNENNSKKDEDLSENGEKTRNNESNLNQ